MKSNPPEPCGHYIISERYLRNIPTVWRHALIPTELSQATSAEVVKVCGIDDLRASLCLGDPDIAEATSLVDLERFIDLGDGIGQSDNASTFVRMTRLLLSTGEATQICCFEHLVQKISTKIGLNRYWQECYRLAHKSRERLLKGKSSGMKISTALLRFYAYQKAAVQCAAH